MKAIKIIFRLLATLLKITLGLLALALLLPILYFSWRYTQPMELPGFNGLTYIQYFEWRNIRYQEQYELFKVSHPDTEIKNPNSCIQADLLMDNFVVWPLAAVDLTKDGKSPWKLSNLWLQRETLLWKAALDAPYGSEFCRFYPDVPSPEEFQSMKQGLDEFSEKP